MGKRPTLKEEMGNPSTDIFCDFYVRRIFKEVYFPEIVKLKNNADGVVDERPKIDDSYAGFVLRCLLHFLTLNKACLNGDVLVDYYTDSTQLAAKYTSQQHGTIIFSADDAANDGTRKRLRISTKCEGNIRFNAKHKS